MITIFSSFRPAQCRLFRQKSGRFFPKNEDDYLEFFTELYLNHRKKF